MLTVKGERSLSSRQRWIRPRRLRPAGELPAIASRDRARDSDRKIPTTRCITHPGFPRL